MRPNQKFVDMLNIRDLQVGSGYIIAVKFTATGLLTPFISTFQVMAKDDFDNGDIGYQEIMDDNGGEPLSQYTGNIQQTPGYITGFGNGYRSIVTSVTTGGDSPALVNGSSYWLYFQVNGLFSLSLTAPPSDPTFISSTAMRYVSGSWTHIPNIYMKVTY